MNVLMIHGIGQEDSTREQLLEKWISSLHGIAPGLLSNANVEMAYYGTTLANWTTGHANAAVPMGAELTEINPLDVDELNFLTAAMEEAVKQNDIDESLIAANMDGVGHNAIPMDSIIGRRLVGLVRAIEQLSPAKGSILLRVVKQGYTYLSAPGAGTAVDNIVRPYLQKSPQVLLTHSLGTVIAFKLLREMEAAGIEIEIPLFITMGSPLGLDAFKKRLGPPSKKPNFVKKWINFYDPSDLVALGKKLDKPIFAAGIENDGTVNNPTNNAHGIVGYLPHKGVINALKEAIGK
jgi:hypothetical protein